MTTAREQGWIECGRVGRPWGIKGELVVHWYSGNCPVEIGQGSVYIRREDGEYVPMRVIRSRRHSTQHVVSLHGITSRNDASELRGATFFLREDDLDELPEGEYYSYQILGMAVVTDGGEHVGEVVKIFSVGGHDVYEVIGERDGKRREWLIPAVDHVVTKIDLDEKKIVIRPIEGLLDEI